MGGVDLAGKTAHFFSELFGIFQSFLATVFAFAESGFDIPALFDFVAEMQVRGGEFHGPDAQGLVSFSCSKGFTQF